MSLELQRELRRLRRGQHICLFYDSRADTLADVGSYCMDGLTHGERCLLAAGSDDEAREIADALGNAGVDVEREVARGAIGTSTPDPSGFFGGYFEPRVLRAGAHGPGHCSEEERTQWLFDQLYRSRADRLALEKAVRARDEFLSAASHELNTPLTSTRLHVQSVLQRAGRSADDSLSASWVSGKLERADEQLDRLVEMIGQLLDGSQLQDTGRVDLRLEALDLGEVVRDAVARFDERARHGCSVQFDAPPAPVVGRWDRKRLAQVVTNVLSNAFKFGAGKPVNVHVSGDGVLGRLVVRDQGIGIAGEELANIFDRFQRGVPVSHYGGFGLGLWIVKEIVEAFGGHIGATGAPGAGATFTIELPRDASRA